MSGSNRSLSMLPTKRYRQQHDEIMRLIEEIQNATHRIGDPGMMGECRTLLLVLNRKLTAHLSQEDNYLYPRLISHENEALREMAISFQEEIGGLREAARLCVSVWLTPGAIAREPARFMEETGDLFTDLKLRIMREETQLYPLIDQIGWSAVTGIS